MTKLPHRGAGTRYEGVAREILTEALREQRAEVVTESFQTPRTYVSVVYWLIGGLLLGLIGLPYLKTFSILITWASTVAAWLYFNWRFSPVVLLPPLVQSHNVIGRWRDSGEGAEPAMKVILMAHYDTAPVSLLYSSGQVRGFRSSLIVSLLLMLLASGLVVVNLFDLENEYLLSIRYALAGYFLLQALLGTLGYWLNGYTNGASDNATGVAAALATAERLRQCGLPGLDLEVVLTGAEEVGMIGARQYLESHIQEWPRHRTFVINFDTLGNGKLNLIKKTGTVESIRYDNDLFRQAQKIAGERNFRGQVSIGAWHTADFDTVWFVREGIPAITLSALDEHGQMPHIHRKEDQLLNTNLSALPLAVDFATQTVVRQYQAGSVVRA
ncbi:M20/M25/M40 family metallo-hydrolase [Tellurirhabdus rosea]|uniref:M20/M25/M40 family metallo-hydrolase n=1 Tax=Tellurirhabdus rosea TaxID=2674997 RepID=UPI002254B56F|nr:M20/M25/M40 family metallo-hydrolase [Tellurirhabdus rosea]